MDCHNNKRVLASFCAFLLVCCFFFSFAAVAGETEIEASQEATKDSIEKLGQQIEQTKSNLTKTENSKATDTKPATPRWQPNRSSATIRNNPFLMNLINQGVRIIPLGHEAGFDGWLTLKDGRIQTFYTHPDHGAVLSGLLIAEDGSNLTAQQIMRYQAVSGNQIRLHDILEPHQAQQQQTRQAPQQAFTQETAAQRFYREAGTAATWFSYGATDTPLLYLFTTVDCDGCLDYFSQLVESYARENIIQIRLVLVGDNPTNSEIAARIMSSASPAESWYGFANGTLAKFDHEASLTANASIAANRGVLESRNLLSNLPLTLYRTPAGSLKIVQGIPENISDIIVDLTIE